MRKIGIITLNGYYNYGNRLQNYALQKILQDLGYDVETILHFIEKPHITVVDKEPYFNKVMRNLGEIKELKNKIIYKINLKKLNHYRDKRILVFKDFTKKHIKETDFYINKNCIPIDFEKKYDYFIAGSDQIWNPLYNFHTDVEPAIEYLTFAPHEKRLSYAASFGISEIPLKFQSRVINGLNGMKSILVREEAGARLVKELTNRDAYVVLDPTMLLTKEQWLEIALEHEYKPNEEYLLTYFLGKKTKETQQFIKELAKKNNLEVVHLEDVKYKNLYTASPSHFIDYINSASLICTDSFHGTVFSIILETPFIVFKREESGPSMYSRIETLLNTFGLQERTKENINLEKIYDIDFDKTKEILSYKREESLEILKNSFL